MRALNAGWGRVVAATWLGVALAIGGCSALPDGQPTKCVDLLDTDFSANNPRCYNGTLDAIPSDGLPTGLGVGADCSLERCRPGLECVDDRCEPSGSLAPGSSCVIGPECGRGLNCVVGSCIPSSGDLGESCQNDSECDPGLRCGLSALSSECVEAGNADFGQACVLHADCFQGLYCSAGQCALPEAPAGVPLWKGVTCSEPTDDDVTALFSVPGAAGTASDADFFQLPYPNDIRLDADGHPDLTEFPTPGPELLGVDMIARYARAIERATTGWSTHPSLLFRFSGAIDADSLKTPDRQDRRVVLVDADDPTSEPNRLGLTWSSGGAATAYVCDDWVALGTGRGGVLQPGHTHIAWISTGARAADGKTIAKAPHFEAMLEDEAPSSSALQKAHAHYAPLRAYLAAHSIDRETILVAAVFTTYDPIAPMRALALDVAAADMPVATNWVLCEDGALSPCPQAAEDEGRACGSGTTDYDEYQALIELPIFQKGTPPYTESGGGLSASVVRTEQVCLGLTVPKSPKPAGGFPLVVYGHGTGGSMRSHMRDAISGRLARATPKFAVLGIDQVQHGPRRGDSTQDPEKLFFNFTNPDAARGNPLQGAADQLSLLRWAKSVVATAGETGGVAIQFDPARILYYGHSQGSTHGSIAAPLSDYPGAVFSGNGAGLALALLNKTNPQNIAGALPIALQDPLSSEDGLVLAMGELNPALGLLQHYMDAADPLSFAPLLALRPEVSNTPKHTLQTFGLGDTYSPPQTLSSFIYAAGVMDLASPPVGLEATGADALNLTPAPSVTGNFGAGPTYTLAVRQYEPPAGKDGHYVSFDVAECAEDISSFLEDLATPVVPTVPAAH